MEGMEKRKDRKGKRSMFARVEKDSPKAASQKAVPQKAVPQKAAPQKAAPQKAAPQKTAQGNGSSLRYDVYSFTPGQWILYLSEGAAVGCFVVWLCYHSLWGGPLAAVITFFFVRERRKTLLEEQKRQLHYHFKDFLSSLQIGLRAGYSVENALRSARKDLEKLYGKEDILVQELTEMIRQMGLQIPVESLFLDLGRRSGIEDIQNFGEMLQVAKRTGGNLSAVLQDTWKTLCEKIDTRQEIDTVIASKRYEQNFMSLMPAGIILYLRFTFSGFMEKLYGNALGILLMTVCLAIYTGAFVLGRRLVRIEV